MTAESTLSAGFVSRPPPPVTVAVFVCVPTVVARAGDRDDHRLTLHDRPQAAGDERRRYVQVPCVGLAVRYVMPGGSRVGDLDVRRVFGPLLVTVIV